jgi:hypothetical protein
MKDYLNSDIHLRPRFKMYFNESQDVLISKFKENLKAESSIYCGRIVDNHIIIDVPVAENHFWSPQLNIEIEKGDANKTIVKGLFGPKPQLWTMFMFFHFAMAIAFIGFSIIAYVQWTLKEDYTIAALIVIGLPILWVVMYFLGRFGRSKGHRQMDELYGFMMRTLEK